MNISLNESPAIDTNVSELVPNRIEVSPLTPTPAPVPTSWVKVSGTPYSKPFINPENRSSVAKEYGGDGRTKPHMIYSEKGITLNGQAVGRWLNITNGPFIIDYTVHLQKGNRRYGEENPNFHWAVLTVRDPWGNILADNGYNRQYCNNTNNHITIYKTGDFHLTIEGNFVTMDIAVLTTDPGGIPVSPVPTTDDEDDDY